mmetsp:Transcript_132372/g.369003  ORF Transcript_132372/g.369003 Transcript_132372/m.369003 type:complete len:239 (+) Transcript_132372:546-1262(+)
MVRALGELPQRTLPRLGWLPVGRGILVHGHAERDGQGCAHGNLPLAPRGMARADAGHTELVGGYSGPSEHRRHRRGLPGLRAAALLEPGRERVHLPYRRRRPVGGLLCAPPAQLQQRQRQREDTGEPGAARARRDGHLRDELRHHHAAGRGHPVWLRLLLLLPVRGLHLLRDRLLHPDVPHIPDPHPARPGPRKRGWQHDVLQEGRQPPLQRHRVVGWPKRQPRQHWQASCHSNLMRG